MNRVYAFFAGRTTFFALWFFVIGAILAFVGKLTNTYLGLATGIQLLLVARAVSEDVKEAANGKDLPQVRD